MTDDYDDQGDDDERGDELADDLDGGDDEVDDSPSGATWTINELPNGNVEVWIETEDGTTYHLGEHGGIDPDDLYDLLDRFGEGEDLYDELDAWDVAS